MEVLQMPIEARPGATSPRSLFVLVNPFFSVSSKPGISASPGQNEMPLTARFGFTVANIGKESIPFDGNWARMVCLTEEFTEMGIAVSSATATSRGNGSDGVIQPKERIHVELHIDKLPENLSFARLSLRAPDGAKFEELALLQR